MIILGLAYSFAFIPTFEALLDTVVANGAPDDVVTYSLVSGWWSCFNNLGELAGTALGGLFLDVFGFETGAGIVAIMTGLAAALLIFYFMFFVLFRCGYRKRTQVSTGSDPYYYYGEEQSLLGNDNSCTAVPPYEERQGHRHHTGVDCCKFCDESVTLLGRLSAFRTKKTTAWRKSFLLTL